MSAFLKRAVSPTLLFALAFLFSASLKAQVIFSQDFQTPGRFPFTTRNLDGRTPAANVSFVDSAWVRDNDLDDPTDTVAVSTSWYDPAGAANDWMISPMIHIDSQSILSWEAKAQDADFPDGYEVRISTTDTAIASFLANFALFNINAENPDWTTRKVDLASKGYANQDIYIAFRNVSIDMFLLKIDDIVVRNPYAIDAKAISLQVPVTGCQLGAAEPISVTVENFGTGDLTNFNLTYVVDDGTNPPVTVTETVTDTVDPGETFTYTFTQGANLSTQGALYDISAYVSATADGDLTNDSLDVAVVGNVPPVDIAAGAYTSSFETVGEFLGWSTEDVNNDQVSWFLASGNAHTGDNFFIYQYNQDATTAANDWLFSTCLDLEAGEQYELKFFNSVGNSGGTVFNEKLKVAIGTSADASAMTTVLQDLGELTNDFYEETSIVFTVPSNGVYYIGFHCYSDADKFFLAIDDVTVGVQLPPVANFTTSKDQLEVTFVSTSTGGADSLSWDFGDGGTASTNNPVHTYAAAGTYYVCLTAFNEAGSDTFCDSVEVSAGGNVPVANFNASHNGLVVTFTSTSSDADSLYWDFDDGGASTANPVTHTFNTPGTYNVCLTAVNNFGSDTYCDSVEVDTTTGIVLINESEFSVFPNPTRGTLVVQLNEKVIGEATLTVTDLAGKETLNIPVSNARMQLDLSDMAEGVYFIRLQAGETQLRRKVVLAR